MVDHTIFRNVENFKGLDTVSSDVSRSREYSSDMRNAMYKLSGAICKRKGFSDIASTSKVSVDSITKGIKTFKNVNILTGALEDLVIFVQGNEVSKFKETASFDVKMYLDPLDINNSKYSLPADRASINIQYNSTTKILKVIENDLLLYELNITGMTFKEVSDRLKWSVASLHNRCIVDNIICKAKADVEITDHNALYLTNIGNYIPHSAEIKTRLKDIQLGYNDRWHFDWVDFGYLAGENNPGSDNYSFFYNEGQGFDNSKNPVLNDFLNLIRTKGSAYATKISTSLQKSSLTAGNPLYRVACGLDISSIQWLEQYENILPYNWIPIPDTWKNSSSQSLELLYAIDLDKLVEVQLVQNNPQVLFQYKEVGTTSWVDVSVTTYQDKLLKSGVDSDFKITDNSTELKYQRAFRDNFLKHNGYLIPLCSSSLTDSNFFGDYARWESPVERGSFGTNEDSNSIFNKDTSTSSYPSASASALVFNNIWNESANGEDIVDYNSIRKQLSDRYSSVLTSDEKGWYTTGTSHNLNFYDPSQIGNTDWELGDPSDLSFCNINLLSNYGHTNPFMETRWNSNYGSYHLIAPNYFDRADFYINNLFDKSPSGSSSIESNVKVCTRFSTSSLFKSNLYNSIETFFERMGYDHATYEVSGTTYYGTYTNPELHRFVGAYIKKTNNLDYPDLFSIKKNENLIVASQPNEARMYQDWNGTYADDAVHYATDTTFADSPNYDSTYQQGSFIGRHHQFNGAGEDYNLIEGIGEFLSRSPIRITLPDEYEEDNVSFEDLDSFNITLTNNNLGESNSIFLQTLEIEPMSTILSIDRTTTSNTCFSWLSTDGSSVLGNPSTENVSFASLNNVLYMSNGYDDVLKYDSKYIYRAGLPNAVPEEFQNVNDNYDINSKYMYLFEYTDFKGNTITSEPRYFNSTTQIIIPGKDNEIFKNFDTLTTFDDAWAEQNQQKPYLTQDETFNIFSYHNEKRMRIKIYSRTSSEISSIDNDPNYQPIGLHYLAYNLPVPDYDRSLNGFTSGITSYADERDTNLSYSPDVKRHDPPPKGKYLSVFKNCLVISGQISNKNNVQYSLPYSTSTLEIGSEYFPSDDNAVIVEGTEGKGITAMAPFRDSVYIFHEGAVSILSGDISILDTFSVRAISQQPGIGCVSNQSIKELQGRLIFLSQKGFYSIYNTTQIERFSESIDNLFISNYSNLNLSRAITHIWDERELFLVCVPSFVQISEYMYYTDNNKTLILAYDYRRGAWLRWDTIDFSGGITEGSKNIYFSRLNNTDLKNSSPNYFISTISDAGEDTDYSDAGEPIDFYYETNWESLGQPSVPKKFLRLKLHVMNVDKDFLGKGFNLDINVYKDYLSGNSSTIKISLDNTFNIGWGELPWAQASWGSSWGGNPKNIFIKNKLPNFKAKSLKLVFSNNENNTDVLINNWEYEVAAPYGQEIKD